jgi:multicomponent Na+:H+ antiporter subunit G
VSRIATDILLAILVLAAWLGCAGFARLRTPLDRLHCAAFVNAVSGTALTIAAFVADGVSDRALKVLLITGLSLLAGAAMSHATGRALLLRGAVTAEDGPPANGAEGARG